MKPYFFDPFLLKTKELKLAWEPTPHGETLAEAMTKIPYAICGKSMIEIGTGSGIHAILALKLGARYIDVTDINAAILNEANENAALNNVEFRNSWERNWMNFEPQAEKYDFVLCNPPFAKAKKGDRRWFISNMIKKSCNFLNRGGNLLFSQSSMANFSQTEKELADNGFDFSVIHARKGIFRDYYFSEDNFIEESKKVANGFEVIEGIYVEKIQVYLATYK